MFRSCPKSEYGSRAAGREAGRLPLVHECQVHSAGPHRQRAHVEADHHPGEGPGGG